MTKKAKKIAIIVGAAGLAVILTVSLILVFTLGKTKTLSAPNGVTANAETRQLLWDSVENAAGYKVSVNDAESEKQSGTSYDFSSFSAGTYKFKVKAVGDGKNYKDSQWSNEVSCTITDAAAKTKITKPTLTQTQFTYNGSTVIISLSAANDAYTLGGDKQNTDAGSYTATITLNDTANYQWSDGTTAALNLPWTIDKADLSLDGHTLTASDIGKTSVVLVVTPTALGTLQYRVGTGAWQTSNEFYGLTSDTQYTFYAKLVGDENHNDSGAISVTVTTLDETAVTHKVQFNSNGGNDVAPLNTVTDGAKINPPTPPTKAGWDFDGWYVSPDSGITLTIQWNFALDTVTDNMTLYAKWTASAVVFNSFALDSVACGGAYSVTFNTATANGGTVAYSAVGALPAGLTLSDGVLSGTVTANAGNHSFTIRATCTETNATKDVEFTLTVTKGSQTITGTLSAAIDKVGSDISAVLTLTPSVSGSLLYSKDGTTWQPSNTFTGLSANTSYTFYVKLAGNDNYYESNIIQSISYTTPSATQHTVSFNTHEGSAVASQYINEGGKATRPAVDPNRAGFTFDGWYTDGTYGTAYNFDSTVTQSITIHAKWNAVPISWNPTLILSAAVYDTSYSAACGGATVTNAAVTYSATGLPAGLAINQATGEISGTVTANASATPYTFTVTATCIANGETATKTFSLTVGRKSIAKPALTSASFTYDGNAKTVTLNPAHAAYSLGGTTSATNAGDYTATVTLNDMINYEWSDKGAATYNLPWTINKATVTLAGNYTLTTTDLTQNSVTLALSPILTGPTLQYSKDGGYVWQASNVFSGLTPNTQYTFSVKVVGNSNYNQSDIISVTVTTPANPITTYTVTWKNGAATLETDNGVPEGSMPSYNGATPVKTETAQYTYAFAGWSATDGGAAIPTLPAVSANVTYYAVFTQNLRSYTITWKDADGATLGTTTVAYGTLPSYTLPEDTLEWDYTGWSPTPAAVTGVATYTAIRTGRVFTITLDPNGGVVDPTSLTVAYGAAFTLPTPTIAADNLMFDGWYNGGAKVESGTWNGTASITLTAQWASIFNYNSGIGTITSLKGAFIGSSITIPAAINGVNITAIAASAFAGKTQLTSVTVPNTVTSIGQGAFAGCSGLQTLTLPFIGRGNQYIDSGRGNLLGSLFSFASFTGGYAIEQQASGGMAASTYYLPNSLTTVNITNAEIINYGAFMNCTSLTSISIAGTYTTISGCAFYKTSITSFSIRNGVTSIGGTADQNGYDAFGSCYYLTSVNIPNTVQTIGTYAFSVCRRLASVNIPGSVQTIGNSAFSGCLSMTSVIFTEEGNLKTIGADAFRYNVSLTRIVIPSSVTTMGGQAFGQCSVTAGHTYTLDGTATGAANTLTVYVRKAYQSTWNDNNFHGSAAANGLPATVVWNYQGEQETIFTTTTGTVDGVTGVIITGLKSGYLGTTNLVIPETIDGQPVLSIAETAFKNNTNIVTVVIADSIKQIPFGAFQGCMNITEITLPFTGDAYNSAANASYFGRIFGRSSATAGPATVPASLKTVTLTKGTLNVDKYVLYYQSFDGCGNITTLNLPSGLKEIGANAFRNCASLAGLTLPSGLTTLSPMAFTGCASITSLTIPASVTNITNGGFGGGITTLIVDAGNTVYAVASGGIIKKSDTTTLYHGCKGVQFVRNDTITKIADYAFASCDQLNNRKILQANTATDNSTGSSEITSVGAYAFSDCISLTSMLIPDSVTVMGNAIFYGCTALIAINLPFLNAQGIPQNAASPFGTQAYPESLKAVTIRGGTLMTRAFYRCQYLVTVNLPDIDIPMSCFDGCSALTTVTMPRGITGNIGADAFINCISLASISFGTIGEYKTVAVRAFKGCTSLVSINLRGYSTIEAEILAGCTSLARLDIDFIGNNSTAGAAQPFSHFFAAAGSASVANNALIPQSLKTVIMYGTYINGSTFQNCSYIDTVVLRSANSLMGNVFNGCTSLKTVVIPSSVYGSGGIGQNAFAGCNLTKIFYGGNSGAWANMTYRPTATNMYYFGEWSYNAETGLPQPN